MIQNETFNLALQMHRAGEFGQAESLYRQILAQQPNHHESLHLLGMLACQAGKFSEAQDLVQLAIVMHPAPEYYLSLGVILGGLKRTKDAVAAFSNAVRLRPNFVEAHNNLGNALATLEEWDAAIASFRAALKEQPDYVDAHFNLGTALIRAGQYDAAISSLQRAIELRPEFAEAHGSLGNAYAGKKDPEKAIACYREASRLQPNSTLILSNYAAALNLEGDYDNAISACKRCLQIDPNHADANVTMGVILLLRGQWADGWKHYEFRWDGRRHLPKRLWASQPQWDGAGGLEKRILLHSEQGFGDIIQFARFTAMAARNGSRVILAVSPEILPIVRNLDGVHTAISIDQPPPPFNWQCSLMSLGHVLKINSDNLPADIPYISVDPARVHHWRERFDAADQRRRIGIAWAGRKTHANDLRRSIPPEKLLPLIKSEGTHWINLQKRDAAEKDSAIPAGLTDWTNDLKDFGETAALIANLDLVICADTAVAHLAGAMGKPVWLLLPFAPDWRWMLDREDSPWYPTMRLFRQKKAGDWEKVSERVIEALRSL